MREVKVAWRTHNIVSQLTIYLVTARACIGRGGPGSIFLMDDHTYDHFMEALFLPKLIDRSRYDAWEKDGALNLYDRCNREAKRILAEHEVASKPDAVIKEIDQILKEG